MHEPPTNDLESVNRPTHFGLNDSIELAKERHEQLCAYEELDDDPKLQQIWASSIRSMKNDAKEASESENLVWEKAAELSLLLRELQMDIRTLRKDLERTHMQLGSKSKRQQT